MTHEVVELPCELFEVERDLVRWSVSGVELPSAPLKDVDERDRLPVQRGVLRQRACTQMRLQRDVTQILELENAERAGVSDHGGHGQGHALEKASDGDERK